MKTLAVAIKLSTLAATALIIASISSQAATSSKQCRRMGLNAAECACQDALNSGSQLAIKKFLRLYPRSDTACNAINSTAAVNTTSNDNSDSGNPPGGGNPPPPPTSTDGGKSNNGLGNGGNPTEGDCSGSGCSDSTNPGHNK